jgi:hypothetical protein
MSYDFSKSRAAARVNAEKKAQFVERNYIPFKVDEDSSEVVRFLAADSAMCHKVQLPGQKYADWVVSLDQSTSPGLDSPCPLVQAGNKYKRSFRGWVTVIWRDAPLIQKDSEGKAIKDNSGNYIVIGKKDQVAVWSTGVLVFESLDELDGTYGGLSSRDFRVKRKGSGLDTRYTIQPAFPDGGPQPMSEDDQKLAKNLPDLNLLTKPRSAERIRAYIEGDTSALRGGDTQASPEQASARVEEAVAQNPFAPRA